VNGDKLIRGLEKALFSFDKTARVYWLMLVVTSCLLFIVMLLGFVDVFSRYVFGQSISGVAEISGLAFAVAVFFGIAYVGFKKLHIGIDIFSNRLPHKARIILNMIVYLFSAILFALMSWQSIEFAMFERRLGTEVAIIGVPTFPFLIVAAFGCLALCLVLLRHFLESVVEGMKAHIGVRLWMASLGITALLVTIIVLWLQPSLWQFEPFTVGIIGLVVLFFGLFSGIPIAFLLLALAFLLLSHSEGFQAGFMLLGVLPFKTIANYTWVVLAFFIIMGYEVLFAGLGTDLYNTAEKWLGRLPGGLGIATVGAGAAYAAIVGDAASSTATLTAVSLPEMRRYKYDDALATGCIAATATLGPLIPPSITFIIFGIATYTSIGKLFVAGIVPGLLLALFFMSYIYIRCRRNPKLGPIGAPSSFKAKLISLKAALPVAIIFILVIGGIYAGIFSPMEGGAIGGTGVLIVGLIMRRLTLKKLFSVVTEAGKLLAMVFLIVLGGIMFGYFLSAQGITEMLANAIVKLPVMPWVIIAFMCVVYLILGCFVDAIPILLITLPIFFPVALELGYDPIWFGVITVIFLHVGFLTPPFGPLCFIIKGIATDISFSTIFRGVFPFILLTIIVGAILIAFPQIVTFLPSVLTW